MSRATEPPVICQKKEQEKMKYAAVPLWDSNHGLVTIRRRIRKHLMQSQPVYVCVLLRASMSSGTKGHRAT